MRLRGRVVLVCGLVLLGLVVVVAARALFVSSQQPAVMAVAPFELDRGALAARLSEAIRFRTIAPAPAEFAALADWLGREYPNVHRVLEREIVGDGALLYTWKGSQPDLPALLLLGHTDVVPVESASESQWSHPPFGGAITDDSVWGRGALDDKAAVLAILEASEHLIAGGFQPRRTMYFAFGHDEEVGGEHGAKAMAELLESRGARIDALIDEGGIVAQGIVPGMSSPVALVGVAEKGYVDVELRSEGEGGHSSMPPAMTHVGRVARAVDRLQRNPLPADLRGATRQMFEMLAPEMDPGFRVLAANLWIFKPLIEWQTEASLSLNATLRTTSAPTMISGGIKENVIPSTAQAVVNFRILPGDSVEDVLAHVRKTIDDPLVQVRVRGTPSEPSKVSSIDAPQFRSLAEIIRGVFPDAVVAPYLVVAATDARHYARLTQNSYRFLPVRFQREDLQRMHGVNERILIKDYLDAVRFYRALIERSAN